MVIDSSTWVIAFIAGAVFMVLGIIQPGLQLDRREFGTKKYMAIEAVAFLWMFIGTFLGVMWLIMAWALDYSAGIRGGQLLTESGLNTVLSGSLVFVAVALILQWSRLFAASRKQLRVAQ
ncbi:hypothetical protein ABH924_004337 [Arthrobacter sp. GAS37]|uniref:hypothetical protein n=1 Tax=Arthrobacter sp. GAS37 TaxID=3156261 RepID=UPI0038387142